MTAVQAVVEVDEVSKAAEEAMKLQLRAYESLCADFAAEIRYHAKGWLGRGNRYYHDEHIESIRAVIAQRDVIKAKADALRVTLNIKEDDDLPF